MSGEMTWEGLRCGVMRVVGIPYVNQGEIFYVFNMIREFGGSRFNTDYDMSFNTFLRVVKY
jgi:hypothetical protein